MSLFCNHKCNCFESDAVRSWLRSFLKESSVLSDLEKRINDVVNKYDPDRFWEREYVMDSIVRRIIERYEKDVMWTTPLLTSLVERLNKLQIKP